MSIEKSVFGKMPDGTVIESYTLRNKSGMTAQVITYGCRIVKLLTADKKGKFGDVVLGHDTLEGYLGNGDVFGAVVGRYANRIGGAEFEIDGQRYSLAANNGKNSLHSAPGGFQDRVWRLKRSDNDDDALIMEYGAQTDHETPVNLTNHSYFNIGADVEKSVLSEELQINADDITAVSEDLIPTGELTPVAGTPYDFNKPKTIGQDIKANDALLRSCGGYDHNFVIRGADGIKKAAELYDQLSGRAMAVFTDMPGIQIYTANSFTPGATGKAGKKHMAHHAICLETQFFPDSVHHPEFPFHNLKPGEKYKHTTIYKFTIR
ncbi:aldose epimerase family protein [Caproiciproducens sp.]|uniref:aldose epimerase family protein n=1 Tax=Caproiciproducens sp. TaxID=1954376 RepID=UPI0028964E9D|nr:aldose epimerase family protein [Caproiciproducens sp.]